MDDLQFRKQVQKVRVERLNIGDLLHYVKVESFDDGLKRAIRAVLYWLKSEDTPLFRSKKHQRALDRKNWHLTAELMGLKHYTVEYTQRRFFCDTHKKYCSKWRYSAGEYSSGQCYDSDHECSGDGKERYWEEDHCCPEEKIMQRRNVYILSPELANINTVEQLENYLKLGGYMDKPPFYYPYKNDD